MLPLEDFDLAQPRTLEEAIAALREGAPHVALLAGGTDLLPNLKHGLQAPRTMVSLRRVAELNELRDDENGELVIGAGITLARLSVEPRIIERYPALATAADMVASPQVRSAATLGGNLCLDTRCVYYNQTKFWRAALGYCIKKDGDSCHVVEGGTRCVASLAADTPAPLCCYGAKLRLVSPRGERVLDVADFYRADGASNTVREPDEILVNVRLPRPTPGLRSCYVKLRRRSAIDYPQLSVALAVRLDADERVEHVDVVLGALQARPRRMPLDLDPLRGRPLDDKLADDVATQVEHKARPLESVIGSPEWRRRMTGVLTRRAFDQLARR